MSDIGRNSTIFHTRLDTIFPGTRPNPFSVLARILAFSGTRPNCTILWYSPRYYLSRCSPGPFFGTHPDSTLLRHWPQLYHSSVLTWILPYLVLSRTLFRYSHGVYPSLVLTCILPFPVLTRTLFRYSPRFYPSSVIARILPFSSTGPNSTILRSSLGYYLSRYSPGPIFSTRTDSTLLR